MAKGKKVVVRRIPPNFSEDDFKETVGEEWLKKAVYYKFCEAPPCSIERRGWHRAYFSFMEKDLWTFHDFVLTIRVPNPEKEKRHLPLQIEFAGYQKLPRRDKKHKKDRRQGTVDKDPEFVEFAKMVEERKAKAEEVMNRNVEAVLNETLDTSKPEPEKPRETTALVAGMIEKWRSGKRSMRHKKKKLNRKERLKEKERKKLAKKNKNAKAAKEKEKGASAKNGKAKSSKAAKPPKSSRNGPGKKAGSSSSKKPGPSGKKPGGGTGGKKPGPGKKKAGPASKKTGSSGKKPSGKKPGPPPGKPPGKKKTGPAPGKKFLKKKPATKRPTKPGGAKKKPVPGGGSK